MKNTEKTFVVNKPKFKHSFHWQTMAEKRDFNAFVEKYEIVIHANLDAGMYGNRKIHWSSDALTSGQILVGSGYESLHGAKSYYFSSDDKPLEKESN